MDPMQFDDLTRALTVRTARTPTRRTVLATLVAGVAAVGSRAVPAAAKRKKCKGKLKCNGVCIDPQSDFSNCGTCGNVCGQGQTCTRGVCTDGPVASCVGQPDLTLCGGGRQCSGGVCADPPTCGVAPDACASGLDCCGNACDPAVGSCPLSAPGNLCRTSAS